MFQATLASPPAWCWGLRGLLATAAASLLAWTATAELAPAGRLLLAIGGASALLAAWPLARSIRGRLRWDGVDWWWTPRSAGMSRTVSRMRHPAAGRGQLRVAIDVGTLILMRFDAEGPSRRTRWIPASRRSVGNGWHALRSAVYSAPLQADPLSSGDAPGSAPHRRHPNES